MTFYPEQVVWQSPNGKWNFGVYRVYRYAEDDIIADEVLDDFVYLTVNHASLDDAENAWKGLLSKETIIEYDVADETVREQVDHLEELKTRFIASLASHSAGTVGKPVLQLT